MRSPQLTLCAAIAACALTTTPAYAATAAHGPATAPTTVAPAATTPPRTPPAAPHPAGPDPRQIAAHRELSSTSAVGLVLAGGAALVIAGQLLRLRLRLRRERQGNGSADEH
ncbi:hypothetical protein [Streptomyces noursei]|uniref:hypothetical protein n=1 Tax=Streptomyces noursei TaxID=1971 RepID=UPI001962F73A|nr:hypothetical protein [Streptomyces noursei]QRX92456.1 hypothetical protein JNO44_17780 [Streptomyces noursei]